MQPFERLVVWSAAHALAVEIFHATAAWRERELRSQLRRCSASIAANIAEGAGCETRAQFARYLGIAQASASELRYHLRYSRDVGLLGSELFCDFDARTQRCRRTMTGLQVAVRSARSRE